MCKRTAIALLSAVLAATTASYADETFPAADWKESANPFASPHAVVGGEIAIFAGQSPKSFNYYLDNNVFSAELFGAMYENLLGRDPISLDYVPALAAKWSISEDKKTFTFWLDRKARWSDGRPVTAHDVAWTFATIMKPENLTGVHKVALEVFDPPEVLDEFSIRFTAREVHWRNLSAVGGFHILPRHTYENLDFNKINFEFPVVSGFCRLGEHKEGLYATLERRGDYWNRQAPGSRGVGNFQTMKFRFYEEAENAFEAFKKGMIDLYPVYTSHIWVNQTSGDSFDKNWIVKQKIVNYNPVGFQGFAMNMRRFPFNDVKVRKAMCLLLNRRKMNQQLMYNAYFMHRSYFEDLYDDKHPCPNEMIEFDKAQARQLLAEAGWTVSPQTGVLEKEGKPFRISFLTRSSSSDKFLAIYAEDLKDIGVELQIDRKDWSAWAKDMDEFNYDMTWAAWSAGIFKDPEGMWSSKEADRVGGNNITGFKDGRVDQLIEKQKTLFDVEARHDIVREIDQIAYREFPYVLLWNINYTRLLYWNKFGTPDTVLGKHGDERSAYWLWWMDEDSVADLSAAMKNSQALPGRPASVVFDDVFKRPAGK